MRRIFLAGIENWTRHRQRRHCVGDDVGLSVGEAVRTSVGDADSAGAGIIVGAEVSIRWHKCRLERGGRRC